MLGINLKLIFMKNLELTQMENLNGGCSNTIDVINGVGIASTALGALLVTTTGGLALFAIGAFAGLYSIENCID